MVGLDPQRDLEPGTFTVQPWRAFADHANWDALAESAAEANPFAERWFLAAGLESFGHREGPLLATLTIGGRLAGILPIARSPSYAGYPLPHLGNWRHANAFLGAPLVAAGYEHEFWRALLDWSETNAGTALFLHLDMMPTEGPLYAALRDVCGASGRTAAVVQRYGRAMLRSSLSPQAYFEDSMSGKKRKELRRQSTRLSELGKVAVERNNDGDGLREWCGAFLSLEAAGWKGKEGSALACDPAKTAFFRNALTAAAAAGKLERLSITLDGRPIAMLANIIAAPGAFSFKTAYDESLARYSPGVLLQRENLALLSRDDIAWTDSCAAPDHPMIERIWREKREIARVSIAIGGRFRRAVAALLFRAEIGAPLQGL